MSYWVNERNYKSLKEAIIAYEEYKKNKQILEGKGLEPLHRNINTRVSTYVDFGPPGMPDAKIGTLYFDKKTNKMWVLNSEKKWVYLANYNEYKRIAAKDNKIITNCRNCGAPVYGYRCKYCGTHY